MTEKYDRLTAFLDAYGLRTEIVMPGEPDAAHLLIAVEAGTGAACRIELALPGAAPVEPDAVGARVAFGGTANPLLAALPAHMTIALDGEPALRAIADLFVAEARQRRCGGATVRSRLGEVLVVLAIRRAIDQGAVGAGLLAGLAHPQLHRALVAMHDDPRRAWAIDDLCTLADMSRGHFIARFRAVVGQTPAAYLAGWRLTLGRQVLRSGHSVKTAAHRTGFGSAAAFSRAFSRRFGHAPASVRPRQAAARP